jgi:hypothetical protein
MAAATKRTIFDNSKNNDHECGPKDGRNFTALVDFLWVEQHYVWMMSQNLYWIS